MQYKDKAQLQPDSIGVCRTRLLLIKPLPAHLKTLLFRVQDVDFKGLGQLKV